MSYNRRYLKVDSQLPPKSTSCLKSPIQAYFKAVMELNGHKFIFLTDNIEKYEKVWFDSIIKIMNLSVKR